MINEKSISLQDIKEVRAVDKEGTSEFEEEVNRLLKKGWVLLDLKIIQYTAPTKTGIKQDRTFTAVLGHM